MMVNVRLTLNNATAQLDSMTPRVYIGRDEHSCTLVTAHQSLSRRHAEVMLAADGQLYIQDLGSSNGTWVNGQAINQPVALGPDMQVFLGQVPLLVEWLGAAGGATMLCDIPATLQQAMQAHLTSLQNKASQPMVASVPAKVAPNHAPEAAPADLGIGGADAPLPNHLTYRRQGSNSNGVLLIALPSDTFDNNTSIDGYLEYTALDNETIASITIDLVEVHKKGAKKGHIWDRVLVRQGPWKSKKGDVVPMPFQLRVPNGCSSSGPMVQWELRGYVDINWAFDVEATSPIMVRNRDIEMIRDALGALDFRVVDLAPQPLGQRYTGVFQPPTQLRKEIGITNINLDIEYLGTNLKVKMEVEKTKLFKFDKKTSFVFDLEKLRAAPREELSRHFDDHIAALMAV